MQIREALDVRVTLLNIAGNLSAINRMLPTLTSQIPHLLSVLYNAQNQLITDLTPIARKQAKEFTEDMIDYVEQYTDHVEHMVRNSFDL